MIFAVFDPSPLTVCINCSFLHVYILVTFSRLQLISYWRRRRQNLSHFSRQLSDWSRLGGVSVAAAAYSDGHGTSANSRHVATHN